VQQDQWATVQAREKALRAAAGDAAPQGRPVVWLRPLRADGDDTETSDTLEPVPTPRREALVAHLMALAADPHGHPRDPALSGFADAVPSQSTLARSVCGYCRGRCCRDGLGRLAFIDGPLLLSLAQRTGKPVAALAADYARRIPAQHVAGSCLFHGARGCVLPRDRRAPVCNHFLCDRLQQVQALQRSRPGQPVLLAVARGPQVLRWRVLAVRGGRVTAQPPPASTTSSMAVPTGGRPAPPRTEP
jgi:hypothetical protein